MRLFLTFSYNLNNVKVNEVFLELAGGKIPRDYGVNYDRALEVYLYIHPLLYLLSLT